MLPCWLTSASRSSLRMLFFSLDRIRSIIKWVSFSTYLYNILWWRYFVISKVQSNYRTLRFVQKNSGADWERECKCWYVPRLSNGNLVYYSVLSSLTRCIDRKGSCAQTLSKTCSPHGRISFARRLRQVRPMECSLYQAERQCRVVVKDLRFEDKDKD